MVTVRRLLLFMATLLAGAMLQAAPASAQATRTWVSGVGDDVNPCSRTAPCKTFAGAISKTAAGGEINCLDPGGWGAVTITKALTIDCAQFPGGILNAGSNGIIVNAGATDVVTIRGLEIQGGSTSSPGLNGFRFIAGGALILEDMVIRGNTSSNGYGISFTPSGTSRLALRHVTLSNNGTGNTGGGILVQPTGTGAARVSLDNVTVVESANNALRFDTTDNTGPGSVVDIEHSVIAHNANGIAGISPASTSTFRIMIRDTSISNNTAFGVLASGTGTAVQIGGSTIAGNNYGVIAGAGGSIVSFADNQLSGNNTNGVFTGTVAKQ